MHLVSNCEATSAPNSLSDQVVSASFALRQAVGGRTGTQLTGDKVLRIPREKTVARA
jgi:hypothetical protein